MEAMIGCPRLRSGNAGQRNFQSGSGRQHPGPQHGSGQGQKFSKQNKNVRFGAMDVDPEQDTVMYDQTKQDLTTLSQEN